MTDSPHQASMLNHQTLIDLRNTIGDSFGSLMQAFTTEIDARVESIVATHDLEEIRRESHTIKGTAAAYGADRLSALAGTIETCCLTENSNKTEMDPEITELSAIWAETKAAIKAL